jgi:hypothetical protein
MFLHADMIVKAVMIELAVASLVTWTVWLAKSIELLGARAAVRRGLRVLVDSATLAQAHEKLHSGIGPVVLPMQAAANEIRFTANLRADGLKERIAWQLERIEMAAGRKISRGTGVLATIGATAPFVGLFGTVGLRSFSAKRRRTVSRETLACSVSLISSPRQQLQRPPGAARRRLGTGRRYQQGLLFARELTTCSRARLFAQRCRKVAEHEALLGPVDGRAADTHAGRNSVVADAGVSGQQNLRSLELARCMPAAAHKRREFGTFGLAEFDPIAYIHPRLLHARSARTAESDGRRESRGKKLHAQAGPISGVHSPLHAATPPATSRNRYAAVFSRQPAFGSPDGVDA